MCGNRRIAVECTKRSLLDVTSGNITLNLQKYCTFKNFLTLEFTQTIVAGHGIVTTFYGIDSNQRETDES